MKNQGFRYSERGGAIVWIFIMIALLAILTFAATRGNRGGISNMDNEKTDLSSSEILSFANGVREGVRALKIKGCADTHISFETGLTGVGYNNPNAPTDESCHVFKNTGAGLSFMPALDNWFDVGSHGATHYGRWFFSGFTHVAGIGTDGNAGPGCTDGTGNCKELIVGLPFINLNLCKALNRKLGFGASDGTPPVDAGSSFAAPTATAFNGVYSTTGVEMGTGATAPDNYTGKMAGCVESQNIAGTYHFYQVLLAR